MRAPRSVCCRDTAGQERFRTITTAYYRGAMVGAHGAARVVRLPADQRGLRCCGAAGVAAPSLAECRGCAGCWEGPGQTAAVTHCELTPIAASGKTR